MKNILSNAQNLALRIKKGIKDHYLNDSSLLKEIHDNEDINNELEKYFYLTYKYYDKLRIIILNILKFILHDFKNKKENIIKNC